MDNLLKTFFILLLFSQLGFAVPQKWFFCHSDCISYTGACFDVTADSCYVCADSIYADKNFVNPYNPCAPKTQRAILFKELDSNGMNLTGYSTSNSNPHVCSNITFSGKYINTDYLEKNFTGITT
jgi:hypothetical protein